MRGVWRRFGVHVAAIAIGASGVAVLTLPSSAGAATPAVATAGSVVPAFTGVPPTLQELIDGVFTSLLPKIEFAALNNLEAYIANLEQLYAEIPK